MCCETSRCSVKRSLSRCECFCSARVCTGVTRSGVWVFKLRLLLTSPDPQMLRQQRGSQRPLPPSTVHVITSSQRLLVTSVFKGKLHQIYNIHYLQLTKWRHVLCQIIKVNNYINKKGKCMVNSLLESNVMVYKLFISNCFLESCTWCS